MRDVGLDSVLRVRVPAKINLFLGVRGLRADGYHELVTVMQTVSLYDALEVGLTGPPGRGHHPAARKHMGIELRVDDLDGLPAPDDNLVLQAARALGSRVGLTELASVAAEGPRTVIDLSKRIPIAGGMAGGSADAAATLVALNELWRCELDREGLKEVAAEVGSDVPFCVIGGTAIATGRGTSLAQVLCRGSFSWVVCTAGTPLQTAEVYRAWDRTSRPSEVEPDAVLTALRSQDPVALGAALHNDLEAAAFALRPELAEARAALLDAGALGAVLSGSGPTLLALCADPEAARVLADRVRADHSDVVVTRSPAGGPDLERGPAWGAGRR